jgi:nucleotide-binding universal stress UspA family protein
MACSNRGVNAQVTRINEPSANSIVEESRFADLLIINADTSFKDRPEGSPSQFVKEILAETECAVILAPYSFFGVDEILLTYDGSKSSVFAIKQFAYLFPELKDKKVNLVQIDEEELVDSTETEKIRELLKLHFPNFEIQHIKGKPADELFGYLLGRKNLFVVMGAYGRTLLSNLFRPSAASLVVKAINLPLFIAHYQ